MKLAHSVSMLAGVSLAETSARGAPNSTPIPTPSTKPRTKLFQHLKTLKQDTESPPAAVPASHPLSPPQQAALLLDLSDSRCTTPRKKPSRGYDECDENVNTSPSHNPIDFTSPLKKRAVSVSDDQGEPSPVKSSPATSGVIDLLDSPVPRQVLKPQVGDAGRRNQAPEPKPAQQTCVYMVDSDSD